MNAGAARYRATAPEGSGIFVSTASNAAESLLSEPTESSMLGFYTPRCAAMIAANSPGLNHASQRRPARRTARAGPERPAGHPVVAHGTGPRPACRRQSGQERAAPAAPARRLHTSGKPACLARGRRLLSTDGRQFRRRRNERAGAARSDALSAPGPPPHDTPAWLRAIAVMGQQARSRGRRSVAMAPHGCRSRRNRRSVANSVPCHPSRSRFPGATDSRRCEPPRSNGRCSRY